jgi:hypothetical protein
VTEPAPDDHERRAFKRELDGVRVAQLVRGKAAPTPSAAAVPRSCARAAATDEPRPRVGP